MFHGNESIFQRLLESAPDAIIIVNAMGRIVFANAQVEVLFGWPGSELVGQPVEVLLPGHLREIHVSHRQSYSAHPHPRPMGVGINLTAFRQDGTEFPVEVSLSPLLTEDGLLVTSFVRDITERKRHEQQLRDREMLRAEQLAAVGQVAAGVAHELRNPLTSIKGLVQVNRREAEARGLPAEDLRIIEHEIRRMERTLQTFLDFARPPLPERGRVDLANIVTRVLELVAGRAAKQRCAVRFAPPTRPLIVDADQDQLQQLALNLVLNTLDAMPRGGSVEIQLRPNAGCVELLVADSGPGIAAELLPRIFEPFVSSKETGVGLGLAVSRRIAEDNGGTLAACNQPNGGACFTLTLPLHVPGDEPCPSS